jgi:hypothetical protein
MMIVHHEQNCTTSTLGFNIVASWREVQQHCKETPVCARRWKNVLAAIQSAQREHTAAMPFGTQ